MYKIILTLLLAAYLHGYNFNLVKLNQTSSPTLLVIGGIHGNEPGGYFAPSILATHYKILKGSLWIIPNLNANSIQADQRGINGDMNRKFSVINNNDADRQTIEEIKKVILEPQVDLILNLHDGHGFYRKNYKSTIFNANAWGQTCVIDQSQLELPCKFGNLDEIAQEVSDRLNSKLLEDHHSFSVKNTQTKFEDEAMRLSLTYFAVTHNKPAFAIETSKNLSTLEEKVFYQLRAIEGFMSVMGIEYKRDFELETYNISQILKDFGKLKINSNIALELSDVKPYINYLPMFPQHNKINFTNLLGSFKRVGNHYDIFIGNKKISTIFPQRFHQMCSYKNVEMELDGNKENITIPSTIEINDDFKVINNSNIRVNVIGYSNPKFKNESNIKISKSELIDKFSVDKNSNIYRIEFYEGESFCGMLNIKFKENVDVEKK